MFKLIKVTLVARVLGVFKLIKVTLVAGVLGVFKLIKVTLVVGVQDSNFVLFSKAGTGALGCFPADRLGRARGFHAGSQGWGYPSL